VKVIPAIDMKDGRCVRLYKGRFDEVTEYEADPAILATDYARQGADWIHCVDLDGARHGAAGNLSKIREIAARLPGRIQVGGGVRDATAISVLLEAGAGRAVIGSAAVQQPESTRAWLQDFGAERIVLALDVSRELPNTPPMLVIKGWTETSPVSLWQALDEFTAAGLRHVLCTDISRDGAMTGPAVDLYEECAGRYPGVAFQASGGVRDLADLRALEATGVDSAIVGKALLEGRITETELRPFLQSA
jgi:phosphoribosylformimino-5-aminoimidazole carboxamide ribotide isomerase